MRGQSLKPQWFHILLAVADQERHGLGIVKEVLDQTDGRMRLWPTTLYGSLKKMVSEHLLAERDAPAAPGLEADRRRFYGITPRGRQVLAVEVHRMQEYVRVAGTKNVIEDPA